ncbi:glycosyltransferase family 2 protein [Pedobacter yulinensis]|uniref:Glycosyltransferase family 2 protein n=1 Tax=Pedobacter yulinensis TaxID=2126353 RepID=A0A2T3HLP7_9SPHI|nr:glycosyltransferase family 2 protein [Pedobacter yulinensis]PST83365.1 glycosyltransferase family 2 protein [Pedobacter yulinensis]
MPLLSIITVNYNQPEATLQLLDSISACAPECSYELILVDNGSGPESVEQFKLLNKDIQFIRSEKNLGFAGGNNLGIRQATGKYLFLVNNDTEFTPGLADQLIATLERNPQAGMVSPKIRYYDEKEIIQYAGFTPMNYFTCRNRCIGQWEVDKGQYDNYEGETGFVHGAAMMVSRQALVRAGMMAENYFLYYEEMDWCDRISQAGFKIMLNTRALIFHKESLAVGKKSALKEYFMNRNRILFIRRNAGGLQRTFFWLYFVTFVAMRNTFAYLKNGDTAFIAVFWRAVWWNLTQRRDSTKLGFDLK